MTAYPAAGDYYKAVQAPARVFTVPKLQAAEQHLSAWAHKNCGIGTTTTG